MGLIQSNIVIPFYYSIGTAQHSLDTPINRSFKFAPTIIDPLNSNITIVGPFLNSIDSILFYLGGGREGRFNATFSNISA